MGIGFKLLFTIAEAIFWSGSPEFIAGRRLDCALVCDGVVGFLFSLLRKI